MIARDYDKLRLERRLNVRIEEALSRHQAIERRAVAEHGEVTKKRIVAYGVTKSGATSALRGTGGFSQAEAPVLHDSIHCRHARSYRADAEWKDR